MPTSPHRSRAAAWRVERDLLLTARRPPRSSNTRRSARKVQSSKSRCASASSSSFPAALAPRSPPLRDATVATMGSRVIRRTSRLSIARRDERASRCGRSRNGASRTGPRRPRRRRDARVVPSRPSIDRSAHPRRRKTREGPDRRSRRFRLFSPQKKPRRPTRAEPEPDLLLPRHLLPRHLLP